MATREAVRLDAGSTAENANKNTLTGKTTRLDPPHVPVSTETRTDGFQSTLTSGSAFTAPEPCEEFTSLSDNSLRVMEQLQHHANQLATHLQRQQKDLDDRESRLNAHVASQETEHRTARMQLVEWEKQLEEMERSLTQREASVRARELSLSKTDPAKKTGSTSAAKKEKLHSCHQESATAKSPSSESTKTNFQDSKLSASKQDKAAGQTPDGQLPVTSQAELAEEGPISRTLRKKQESFANGRRDKLMVELMKKKDKLDQRADQLERRRADLDDLRCEVTQLHKDTLEMRLATEELWVRLSGRMPPSAMTCALAELRGKLSDHYRLASAHLAQQRSELETLSSNLHSKYQTLDDHRRNSQERFHRRNQDIEEQAARLVRREQELDRQETLMREFRDKVPSTSKTVSASPQPKTGEAEKKHSTATSKQKSVLTK
ncbi:MAG: hypothetical protein MK179_09425 [Pirellulaceae bacterium]|nr:hypothetical protein [Pirellulaceae bacterium]